MRAAYGLVAVARTSLNLWLGGDFIPCASGIWTSSSGRQIAVSFYDKVESDARENTPAASPSGNESSISTRSPNGGYARSPKDDFSPLTNATSLNVVTQQSRRDSAPGEVLCRCGRKG
ncbi:hypothetical protein AGDE_16611 [Angomonas deanei]|uniref:Uncharacterized protein n=1 Tax=Angomonas deanei TaxID=59799 RepID=A0A7G2C2V4_9TRYP|nr:hypothetical protein AGDE_16611 [Angomonas deanei]CAD2213574.1 hypothetical protein, conserved [Angomonas deanei]|eukprot:EPY16776.1 hypothetical protein AGDE_16611 [Angomonas deanei]